MSSITSLQLAGALAGLALPGAAVIAGLSAAQAEGLVNPCVNAIAILNEGKIYDAFDKANGGGDRRLRFRLDGNEPCPAGGCRTAAKADGKAATGLAPSEGGAGSTPAAAAEGNIQPKPDPAAKVPAEKLPTAEPLAAEPPAAQTKIATKIEIVARAAAGDRVIATIDLAGRSASYCMNGVNSVDSTPAQRRAGCPPHYLVNFLAIKLVDGDGPFVRRDISIQYVYRGDAGASSVDHCMPPAILDGMFRRRLWTVLLEDGGAAYIGETDFPRDRRAPVPQDAPFATTVSSTSAVAP